MFSQLFTLLVFFYKEEGWEGGISHCALICIHYSHAVQISTLSAVPTQQSYDVERKYWPDLMWANATGLQV